MIKTPCYIVDIDGTVALLNGRSPYDYSKVSEDLPNSDVIKVIEWLYSSGAGIVFVTGRPESCEDATFSWLCDNINISYIYLYMRKDGDKRKDYEVKKEIYEEISKEYKVLGVFEDRKQVVDMWRSLGLTCFQVSEGNY